MIPCGARSFTDAENLARELPQAISFWRARLDLVGRRAGGDVTLRMNDRIAERLYVMTLRIESHYGSGYDRASRDFEIAQQVTIY